MTGAEKLAADARWFLDHLYEGESVPVRIHVRGVWSDRDGMGSILGSPALHRGFADFIELPPTMERTVTEERACFHPQVTDDQRTAGVICPDCAIRNEEGKPIAESGIVKAPRSSYRWPMRAAMDKVGRIPVRAGRPPFDVTLRAFARAEGSIDGMASALCGRWPAMAHPGTARSHLAAALVRARRVYTDVAPARYVRDRRASDAQLDAEAMDRKATCVIT